MSKGLTMHIFPATNKSESHGGRGGRGRGDREEARPPSSAHSSFQPYSFDGKDVRPSPGCPDRFALFFVQTLYFLSRHRKLDVDHLYMSYADIMAKVRQSPNGPNWHLFGE